MTIKRILKKIISIIISIVALVSAINLYVEHHQDVQEYKALYEKEYLTEKDLKTKSNYTYCTSTILGDEGETPPAEVRYKKLYGVEYIGKYKIAEDEGIEVSFWHGGPAKVLILDKDGNERFYEEVTELGFEPGETGEGEYDVYIVGNKFTGRVKIRIYRCE